MVMEKSAKSESRNMVNVATLKAKLSKYLGLAKGGHEVIVTDHKMPVAKLVPFSISSAEGLIAREPVLPLASLLELTKTPGQKIKGFDSVAALLVDRNKR
jgi:prevent-host-death family protein